MLRSVLNMEGVSFYPPAVSVVQNHPQTLSISTNDGKISNVQCKVFQTRGMPDDVRGVGEDLAVVLVAAEQVQVERVVGDGPAGCAHAAVKGRHGRPVV